MLIDIDNKLQHTFHLQFLRNGVNAWNGFVMNVEQQVDSVSFQGKRVCFAGRLGGVNRREAFQLVRDHQGVPVESPTDAELIVLGDEEFPLGDEEFSRTPLGESAARGNVEIITETDFWNRLGMVESQANVRRLYTPAMLAQLLRVPVSVVRRWHRRGLIVPVRMVHRLPYFDFQEVATAKRLAELLVAGASPAAIEKKLAQLSQLLPDIDRPLAQLSVIVEGRQILLRQGEGLIEPDGQMRLDFDADGGRDSSPRAGMEATPHVLQIHEAFANEGPDLDFDEMLTLAWESEDAGNYDDAIELYRAVLMSGGLNADVCFRIAELLYLRGDLTAARERYSMAVEVDEDFVEARANLGCVLAELGETELAIAAFRGAIKYHSDYPDAHYHLGRLLDDNNVPTEAAEHWQIFLSLSPSSPWADEARMRLGLEEFSSS